MRPIVSYVSLSSYSGLADKMNLELFADSLSKHLTASSSSLQNYLFDLELKGFIEIIGPVNVFVKVNWSFIHMEEAICCLPVNLSHFNCLCLLYHELTIFFFDLLLNLML